jgi:hypothetical protein
MRSPVAAKKQVVIARLRSLLRPVDFWSRGATFARQLPDVTHVVALQSSKTTSHLVVLTVNLGVIAPAALQSWDAPTAVWSAQWRARLGELGPATVDTWSIADSASGEAAAADIVALTRDYKLPALDRFSTTAVLLEALDSQTSRGLTVKQQVDAAARIRSCVCASRYWATPNRRLQPTAPGVIMRRRG